MQRKVPIRIRIFFIVLVAVIPTIIIALYTADSFKKTYIQEKTTYITNLCEGFVNEQRLIIRSAEEMLLSISQTRSVQDHEYAFLNSYLRDLMATFDDYSVLLAADAGGTIVASGVGQTGYTVSDRDYFSQAVSLRRFASGGFIVSKSTGRPSLPLALPVTDRKGSALVLVAAFDLANYGKDLSLSRIPSDCALVIFDFHGICLFSNAGDGSPVAGEPVSPGLLAFARISAASTARKVSLEGTDYLLASGVVGDKGRPVYVTIRTPWLLVKKEAARPAMLILVFMLIALAIAFCLSLILARIFLVRRIEVLTGHTRLLAEGKLEIRAKQGRMRDEIDDLQDSFNRMASIIDERSEMTRRTLTEKEQLLGELQKRISDNLQLLSSMVNLQIDHTQAANTRHALMTTHSRVMALSLVYETIFRYSDIGLVDMVHYSKGLCEFLVSLYADVGTEISCSVSGDALCLPIEKSLPIALILNELVSNSILHAFPDGSKGDIRISFHTEGDAVVCLDLSDNGRGFEGDIHQDDTLGFEMIEALIEQLHGSFVINSNSGGTCVGIKFSGA